MGRSYTPPSPLSRAHQPAHGKRHPFRFCPNIFYKPTLLVWYVSWGGGETWVCPHSKCHSVACVTSVCPPLCVCVCVWVCVRVYALGEAGIHHTPIPLPRSGRSHEHGGAGYLLDLADADTGGPTLPPPVVPSSVTTRTSATHLVPSLPEALHSTSVGPGSRKQLGGRDPGALGKSHGERESHASLLVHTSPTTAVV